MGGDIKKYVEDMYDRLHAIPENGFEEFKTSAVLAEELKKFGYEVTEHVGGTGVIGILDSHREGPVVGLRADMDALEYIIDGKSEMRHTCGHDAHSSMLIAAAKVLAEEGIQRGKLMIIFQPAEEKLFGALRMVESGLLNDVQELFGMHVRPVDDTCLGKATPALWHSAAILMTAKIKGVSAHGARPHLGVNAVDVAHSVIGAVNSIRENPSVSHSVKVTKVSVGGDTYNAIPDEVFMALDMRSQTNPVMDDMLMKVKRIFKGITEAYGATYEILSEGGVPAAEYDQEMIAVAEKAIKDVLGEEGAIGPLHNPGGEDFHFLTQKLHCKSAYIGLGADAAPGLHHKDMHLNKEALIYGVKIFVNIARQRLG